MRLLYLDIDTLRPDHLGCYGYGRNTSPNIDRIAAGGVRLENCYVSDAPCLPSRAGMFTGCFGIHTGVVNHGGLAAEPRLVGRDRGFSTHHQRMGLIGSLRWGGGMYPVSFSPFAERHSAHWFYDGWREMYNSGHGGGESAEEIVPGAIDWIARNARRDDWLLHVNIWDPHTPYRAPEAFGNPFADAPIEEWYTEELRQRQWNGFGPGSPQEPAGNWGKTSQHPRQPSQIASMGDYRRWIDGYDCGIRYADEWVGRLLNALADQGVLDGTAIIITSDHGENMGELSVIGDHATADQGTCRVPMILRWPGVTDGQAGRADRALHYQADVGATLVELAGAKAPPHWDGRSFAPVLRQGGEAGREYLVVSQCCWSCQRSLRWGDHLLVRSYHTGLKNYPERMLFNVKDDPHELRDLAPSQPALADRGQALLERWTSEMMAGGESDIDPLWTVMREGGPFHTRGKLADYCARLRATGRDRHAEFLDKHPTGIA